MPSPLSLPQLALALYQPDIPQNVGAMIRLSACFGSELFIVEPCGFPTGDKLLRRVAMDYGDHARVTLVSSFEAFRAGLGARRLLLLSTKATTRHDGFAYRPDDVLMMGRESAGVPEDVAALCTRLRIPLREGARSLNVATAAAIGLAEALRATGQLPA